MTILATLRVEADRWSRNEYSQALEMVEDYKLKADIANKVQVSEEKIKAVEDALKTCALEIKDAKKWFKTAIKSFRPSTKSYFAFTSRVDVIIFYYAARKVKTDAGFFCGVRSSSPKANTDAVADEFERRFNMAFSAHELYYIKRRTVRVATAEEKCSRGFFLRLPNVGVSGGRSGGSGGGGGGGRGGGSGGGSSARPRGESSTDGPSRPGRRHGISGGGKL